MIKSMTGFGRGEASADNISVTTEIKSLNSRYLDISVRLPGNLQDKEFELRDLVQEHVERGKVNLNFRIDKSSLRTLDVTFDHDQAIGYANLLRELKEATGIEEPITLAQLLNFNDLLKSKEEDADTLEKIFELVKASTIDALKRLNEMRAQEGAQLEKDLRGRLDDIRSILEEITEASDGSVEEVRDKLHQRIGALIEDEAIDRERLEMEIAVVADKIDITEEQVRLASHLTFFDEALQQSEPVGRRLNFLLQEMNREINTIGSKANSSEISQNAVRIKENLEKLREQVQNIE